MTPAEKPADPLDGQTAKQSRRQQENILRKSPGPANKHDVCSAQVALVRSCVHLSVIRALRHKSTACQRHVVVGIPQKVERIKVLLHTRRFACVCVSPRRTEDVMCSPVLASLSRPETISRLRQVRARSTSRIFLRYRRIPWRRPAHPSWMLCSATWKRSRC